METQALEPETQKLAIARATGCPPPNIITNGQHKLHLEFYYAKNIHCIWVVLEIMGPSWLCTILRQLIQFTGTKMGPYFWELPICLRGDYHGHETHEA